jgi:host factor-I protein
MAPPSTSTLDRNRPQALQEPYLTRLRDEQISVSLYLVNGIKLQGAVLEFDNHTLLLSAGASKQVVFKHAISTIVPARPVALGEDVPLA